MHFIETNKTRTFVGELTRGMEISKGITKFLQQHSIRCGFLKITGHIDHIELVTDGAKGVLSNKRNIDHASQIISCEGFITEFNGNFSPILYTLVTVDLDTGIHTIGGILQRANVIACDFVLEAYDDIFIRRQIDSKTKLPVWIETFSDNDESDETGDVTPQLRPVSSINEDEDEDEDEDEEIIPEPGDTIIHFKFGTCLVTKYEPDSYMITVKLPSERTARLGVQYLQFTFFEKDENGRSVYKARSRSRKV